MVYNLTTLSSLSYVIATPVLCLGYVLALAAWVINLRKCARERLARKMKAVDAGK
jgi:hypothetical protein